MNEIFTVYVIGKYYYDEEGNQTEYHPVDSEWVDSYWTDEAAALAEAEKLWQNDWEEFLKEIRVFGRKMNVSGKGINEWNNDRDRLIKCWR